MKSINKFFQNHKDAEAIDVGFGGTIKHMLTMLFCLFLTTTTLLASHFRYGLLTATRLSETSTTVTYRLNSSQSWRLGTGAGEVNSSFAISGGNSGGFTIVHTNVIDPSGGWENNSGTIVVTLNKSATPTRISFSSCCKIFGTNNSSANWDQYIILNTNASGSSPVSTLPAIINLPTNVAAATFSIPASDPDAGATLTYGFPDLTSGALSGQTQPAGFTLNTTTGQGTLNTVGKPIGSQYNAMVTVTDNNGNQILLDFLINIVGSSTPPVFVYPPTPANGAVFNVGPGTNLSFPLNATDADAGSTVSLSVSGLSGTISAANFSPALPATGNPSSTTFSWTPTAPELGSTYVLNFIATDNVGVQSTTSVTINVINAFQCSYTSNGTLTVPPGVTSGTYKLWGAGGGSGLTSGSDASGGGGGGGYTQVNRINLIPGSTFPVTVGAGGAPGSDGGFTQLEGAIASGGKAGTTTGNGGFGGGQTSPFNTVPATANFPSGFSFNGGDGGAASSPFVLGGGGGGASASATANGNNGTTSSTSSPNGGAGGATNGGNGGNQGSNGNNGTAIGGGGGGRGSGASTVGGNGAGGQVDIVWNCGTLTSISYASPTVCSYSSPLIATILPATSTGGEFSSPTLGAFLNSSTGAIAPGAPQGTHVITYGWAAFCNCPSQSVTFTLVIAPQAVATGFTYAASPACTNLTSISPSFTTLSGVAGVYTSTPAGLSINATTGVINPSASTPGHYNVDYTVAASGNCLAVEAHTHVDITQLPTIANFDYPGDNTYCAGEGVQTPTSTVTNPNSNAISYSYTTSPGLSLNTTTGAIDPATSTPGVYTVTMTIAAGGGCAAVTATSTVEILARPTATIAYTGNPFCQTVGSTLQAVTITGVTGGPLGNPDWTATPAGLTINPATGEINLNSAPGTYSVKYRFTGANGCLDSSSTSVTIKPRPTSTITYAAGTNPVCSNVSPVLSGNVVAVGPWTLTLSNGQTATGTGNGPWSITINTLDPGETETYIVSSLVDANCSGVANPDMPGTVTITKRTTTSGVIPNAASIKVCENQDASVNVVLTSPANNCAPNPQFSGVFKIEKWNGATWVTTTASFAWTLSPGPSTTGIAAAITIPASLLPNTTSNTILYRVSWVSLTDCNGCSASPLTGTQVLEVVPVPLLTVTGYPTADVCPGTNITFTVNQAAGSSIVGAMFNWVATDAQGNVLGSADNVSFGTNAINTNLGLSCPYNGLVTFTITPLNPNCCNCLGIPLTYSVWVRDIVAPSLITAGTIPASQTNLNLCYSAIPVGPTAAAIQALYQDNCTSTANLTVTKSGTPTGNNCQWSVTYTYVITDACGNSSTAQVSYSGGDKTAPSLTGVLPLGQTNMNLCFSDIPAGPTATAIAALYTDNCSGNTVSATKSGAPTGTNCAWSVTYTYVISDNCGNTTSTAITYSGGDKTAPSLGQGNSIPTGGSNLNLCFNAIPVGPTAADIALLYTDNCQGNTVSATKSGTPSGTNCAWTVTYTYVISDNCGNTTSTAITYSGGDKTAPSLTGVLPVGQSNMNLCFNAIPVGPTAAAIAALYTDNCSGNTVSATKSGTPTGTNCQWSVTYTYVISDNCGNTTSTAITYSGGDKTAPTLTGTLPLGQTNINGCIGSAPTGPTAAEIAALYTDNCGGVVTATRTGAPIGNDCAWSVTYVYIISDACGNTTSTTIIHNGSDRTAPVFTSVIPTQILNTGAGANCSAIMPDYRSLAATTDCNSVPVVYTQLAPNAPGTAVYGFNGTRDVVIMATDACGNTSTTTFVVELKDLTAPNTQCQPFTLVLNAAGTGSIVLANINNGTYDNCTPTSQLVYDLSQTNFTCANVGPNNVTLTVTDLCGNSSTCVAVVTVVDNTKPVITCWGDTTINKDANCTYTMADLTFRVNKSDACGIASVTQVPAIGSIFGASVSAMPVTLTVTDVNGNTSTCTFNITFRDVTPPVIAGCPSNITVYTGPNATTCSQTATWTPPTATDACIHCCTTQGITGTHTPGSTFPVGVTTVTYTAVDVSGNSSTCVFTVTVIDNTKPVISGCPSNITVTTGPGRTTCDQVATWTEPTATDNCTPSANLVRTRSHAPGSVFPVGTTTVTYTFTDAAGNTSSVCSFTVTVNDNTLPTVSCPGNITNPPINASGCRATVATTNPTYGDNCGVAQLTWVMTGATPGASPTTGINFVGTKTFSFGVTTITYTVTDNSGNTSACSFTVTVNNPLIGSITGTSTVLQNVTTTSTIGFNASGGTAPYTFVYTTPNGFGGTGTNYAPGGTIVTNGSNSSTVGGNPNSLVTTLAQSNSNPGVYPYTLTTVTDAFGCTISPNAVATVTILAFNHPAPDLAPNIVSAGSSNIPVATNKEGHILVSNVRVNPTTGVVQFEVYPPANFNLTINPTALTSGGVAVNNNDFNITFYPGLGYAVETKPGVIIASMSNLKLGYTLTATGTNLTTGQVIVNVADNTGGIGITVGDDNSANNRALKTFKVVN